jgi:lipopolysaccharide export system permease protein
MSPAPRRRSPFLGKIDAYIIRKFLVTFFFIFWVILSIAIVIDLSERMGDLLSEQFTATSRELITQYYLPFIPWMGAILAPLLIFLAVIFFTSRMAYNTEVVAILGSGVSFQRFLRPYLLASLLLGGLLYYANHYWVPHANKRRLEFDATYFKGKRWYGDNIHMRLDSLTFMSLQRFKYQRDEGVTFSLEHFREGPDGREMVYKLSANRIVWQPEERSWRIHDYTVWRIDGLRESLTRGEVFDTVLAMHPGDFEVDAWYKESYDRRELREFLSKEREQGSGNLEDYEVESQRRTASAISVVILTLIGATLASRKVRGGMGFHLALGVGLSALYIVFLQISSTFSIKGNLDPVIGTNIPNLVFLLIALELIRRSPK